MGGIGDSRHPGRVRDMDGRAGENSSGGRGESRDGPGASRRGNCEGFSRQGWAKRLGGLCGFCTERAVSLGTFLFLSFFLFSIFLGCESELKPSSKILRGRREVNGDEAMRIASGLAHPIVALGEKTVGMGKKRSRDNGPGQERRRATKL